MVQFFHERWNEVFQNLLLVRDTQAPIHDRGQDHQFTHPLGELGIGARQKAQMRVCTRDVRIVKLGICTFENETSTTKQGN